MHALAAEKHRLRTRLLTTRQAYGNLDSASQAVCTRLATLPELAVARVVTGYAATRSEVDIGPALGELIAGRVTVCLPWVDGEQLRLSEVDDPVGAVAPGWRGVPEPRLQLRRPVSASAVDVVLAPGVGFDPAGHRLGYGGGHFDRLLARLSRAAVVVGIALDEQIVTEVPVAPHDRPVHVIVTPTRTLRMRQRE